MQSWPYSPPPPAHLCRFHQGLHRPVLHGKHREGSFEDHLARAVTCGQPRILLDTHHVSLLSQMHGGPHSIPGFGAPHLTVLSTWQSCCHCKGDQAWNTHAGPPQASCCGANTAGWWDGSGCMFGTGSMYVPYARVPFPILHFLPLCPHRVGTDEFTHLPWRKEDGITRDLKTDESAWDADPISCSTSYF